MRGTALMPSKMNKLSICSAETADLSRLNEIAMAAKRHWAYPESWIELWKEDLTINPDYMFQHTVLKAMFHEEIVGYGALEISMNEAEIGHLWIWPAYIGQGIGKELLKALINVYQASPASGLYVISDPHARGFYERMGFVFSGNFPSRPEGRSLPILRWMEKENEV